MMRKVIVILIAMVALVRPASAEVKFGIKGGIDITKLSFNEADLNSSNRAGFFIGPMVKVTLPLTGLGVDAAALYEQREFQLRGINTTTNAEAADKVTQRQIAIPINLRYGIGLGDMLSVFLFAGPQFAFNVGDKDVSLIDEVGSWTARTSNFSINAGLGLTLLKHLQVTGNYNIPLGKTGEVKKMNGTYDAKTNTWQIGLAYLF